MISTAVADEEETEVTVDVAEETTLDVRPSALDYTNAGSEGAISPGGERLESDEGFTAVEVENIGSNAIEEVEPQATNPSIDPFGASAQTDDQSHDIGNIVTVSTETANQDEYSDVNAGVRDGDLNEVMTFTNRVEYAEPTPPTYLSFEDPESIEPGTEEADVGRIRSGDVEYFWVLYTQEGEDVDDTEGFTLRIGATPHTPTTLGTVDFESSDGDFVEYDQETADVNDNVDGSGYNVVIEDQRFLTFDADATGDSYDGTESVLEDDGIVDDTAYSDLEDLEDEQIRGYNLFLDSDNAEERENHILRARFSEEVENPVSGDTSTHSSGAQGALFSEDGEEALQPGDSFPIDFGIHSPLGIDEERTDPGTVTFQAIGE